MKRVRFKAEVYHGKCIGPYGWRAGVQIVAYDPDTNKRVYCFGNGRTPCYKMWQSYYHYKTGLNKADKNHCEFMLDHAKQTADAWNTREKEKENVSN